VIYVPHAQAAVPVMSFVLRAHADPAALLRPAEQAAWGMGGNLNVFQVETLEERIERLDWIPEASTVLLGLFAALALALGAAGIYAVVSFTVSKRTHEIGVRMSLGASGARVRRMVLAEVMKLTLLGVACGVPLALGLVRVLASQLFGVSTFDPATYLSVVVLLVAVAGAACLGPAYRASRVDAIQALRHP
jgi:ABC-type antimicrobial peptide transport system permease subunit